MSTAATRVGIGIGACIAAISPGLQRVLSEERQIVSGAMRRSSGTLAAAFVPEIASHLAG